MQQINPADAQRIDDRDVYAPLRRDDEWPARRVTTFAACSGDCAQGRRPCITPDACRLADNTAADMTEGMGAVVVPAVVAASLACAALLAFIGGWL